MFEEYNNDSRLNINGSNLVNGNISGLVSILPKKTDDNVSISESPVLILKDLWNDIQKYIFYPENNISFHVALMSVPDIKEIVPDKVLEFTFGDGKKIKTVKDEQDEFDLEKAIGIACLKYLLGGTAEYNKLIKNTIKQYSKKKFDELNANLNQLRMETKKKKKAEKKRIRAERREKEKFEKQVEIQKEAYKRALRELSEELGKERGI